MKNENEKKGLLARLLGRNKAGKGACPCCGGLVIEEVPEDKVEDKESEKSPKSKGPSCCE